jgi:hypothetical protein
LFIVFVVKLEPFKECKPNTIKGGVPAPSACRLTLVGISGGSFFIA